jgi:hypothetical protein
LDGKLSSISGGKKYFLWRYVANIYISNSGQIVRVPLTQDKSAEGKDESSFLDRLFGFLDNELKPEVNKFISKGKDFLEDLELEKKGKEIVEKTKE